MSLGRNAAYNTPVTDFSKKDRKKKILSHNLDQSLVVSKNDNEWVRTHA